MSTIFFLIGCSVLVAIVFLLAFLWAQNNGQNTDLYTPSIRILMDDADDKQTTEEQFPASK
ncbi:cytochrome oxidase maturation protein, cbb3-type [Pedobacter glucosidilyticus]|jgi:cbb3-type cytochrome oxidase maturation protein|uniref:Cbb3-type cytochrome oxidase assembly protein CcoS n=1 Tax=Pedobacter aquae TaxID=2605747 RepID=A0A5C0VGT1_9SPHI|nr:MULTISPECIES: cbb3-type cytochrome oxidase assembly protein CcoS [Pedobacter]KHJ38064.1 cytochrome oxidase maturation protein, cbb3-type [Pedobacter glucosidilyticus]QEK51257.1 cbb3-type cytochrome oxidase assembly protein CcoS [Pedobacter aquae]